MELLCTMLGTSHMASSVKLSVLKCLDTMTDYPQGIERFVGWNLRVSGGGAVWTGNLRVSRGGAVWAGNLRVSGGGAVWAGNLRFSGGGAIWDGNLGRGRDRLGTREGLQSEGQWWGMWTGT